ncbi:hypothetical protein ACQP1G_37675 [Nocardia sp. CA-107356]|uniref:hypothetical protein n=1 Tax=Nocardia sp. CA-107356 TaxID=3239972 RepID=UPI003D932B31
MATAVMHVYVRDDLAEPGWRDRVEKFIKGQSFALGTIIHASGDADSDDAEAPESAARRLFDEMLRTDSYHAVTPSRAHLRDIPFALQLRFTRAEMWFWTVPDDWGQR